MSAEREVEAAMAESRRAALEALNELALINEALSPLEARKRVLTATVKSYMGEAVAELRDGETGVVARIQERGGSPTYDLATLAASEGAPAIIDAARAGMLRVDAVMLDRFRKAAGAIWADDIASVAMPGALTYALIVEGKK